MEGALEKVKGEVEGRPGKKVCALFCGRVGQMRSVGKGGFEEKTVVEGTGAEKGLGGECANTCFNDRLLGRGRCVARLRGHAFQIGYSSVRSQDTRQCTRRWNTVLGYSGCFQPFSIFGISSTRFYLLHFPFGLDNEFRERDKSKCRPFLLSPFPKVSLVHSFILSMVSCNIFLYLGYLEEKWYGLVQDTVYAWICTIPIMLGSFYLHQSNICDNLRHCSARGTVAGFARPQTGGCLTRPTRLC